MYKRIIIIVLLLCVLIPLVSGADDTTYTFTTKYKSGTIRVDDASSDFSYIRGLSGDYVGTTTIACRLTTTSTPLWQYMQRGYITFDTSTLPEDRYIKYINLTFPSASTNTNTLNSDGITIVNFHPANQASITTADFKNFDYTPLANGSAGSMWSLGTLSLDTTSTVVSRTGITSFGILSQEDCSDDESGLTFTASKNYNFQWSSTGWTLAITLTDTPPYDCDINVNPVSGESPLGVTFTDASTGFTEDVDAVYLVYGDGDTYTGTYPGYGATRYHVYTGDATYNYSYRIEADSSYYYSNGSVVVGSVDDYNYEVIVGGLDTVAIEGANVSIWYNGAYQDSDDTNVYGSSTFEVPPYRFVNGTVTKSGYQTAYFDTYIYPENNFEIVTLYADNETPGSGDEYWNYIVTFRDANTHAQLSNVFVDVYTDSGRTNLFLSESTPSGIWTGLLPNGTTFYFTASAPNYVNLTWSYALSGTSETVFKDLIPVQYGSLQPVLNIFVYDTYGTPLNGVGVSVDSDIDDGFHLTNITGYARHFCDNLAYGTSRDYTITASKGGYETETSVVTVSTQQPTVYIFLDTSTVATVTPTGIYTPVATPIWSGDGGEPGNIKEQLINTLMTQFGLSQLEANILMGIILTLLCAVTVGGGLASYGSGSGAGVGAMIGAVVGFSGSSIMGFFPIWILIVVIVLVFAAWFMFRGRDE